MRGCIYILAILLLTVGAMVAIVTAYAFAASQQWEGVKWSLAGGATCIALLLFSSAKLK